MSSFSSFIELLVKQTCRRASHEFEMGSKHSSTPQIVTNEGDATGIYSLEFLKCLYDKPRDNIFKLLKSIHNNDPNNMKCNGLNWLNSKEFSNAERRTLLEFLSKVKDMSPCNSKKWIDLHHYMHYVYRNFASINPDPSTEILSPLFIGEMRDLVKTLLEEDESQLYLRVLALLREYCIFAQWNYSKSEGKRLITRLFYYYEAMLSAAKNLSTVFTEFEVIIYKNYSVCWIDFNTCVFIRYFFDTDYVQNRIHQCLETQISPGDTPAMFGLLDDLKNLWIREQKRIRKINDDHSLVEGTVAYYIEEAMIGNHKKVLTSNFWMERSQQEKNDLDLKRLDHHFFRLLGDPFFHPAGPILDRNGQCICEECLIAKYECMLDANGDQENEMVLKSSNRLTYCRRCRCLVDLNYFHRHINNHANTDDNNKLMVNGIHSSRILTEKTNCTKLKNGGVAIYEDISKKNIDEKISTPKVTSNAQSFRNTCDIHFSKPLHDPNDLNCTKLAFEEFLKQRNNENSKDDQIFNKNVRNFIKIKKDIFNNTTNMSGKVVFDNSILKSPSSLSKKNGEVDDKVQDNPNIPNKYEKPLIASTKSTIAKNTCDTPCKHDETTNICQGHDEVCDHQKEAKKCDCTYCEVFGSTVGNYTHKNNELRNRLRIRLHQRREKRTKDTCKNPPSNTNVSATNSAKIKTAISKLEERVPLPSSPTNIPPTPSIKSSDSSIATSSSTSATDDIHGLVNYIEGNSALNKIELAQKKAAKKARQRQKKEEERIKSEEEQKRHEQEIKWKEAERKREHARKQAEKETSKAAAEAAATKALKELKKKSKKERQTEKRRLAQQRLEIESPEEKSRVIEETIPAMVTIKRVVENGCSTPTVTITLKGSTPDQDKLLYTLVNGADNTSNKSNEMVDTKTNKALKKRKKQQKQAKPKSTEPAAPEVVSKELKVTVSVEMNKNQQSNNAANKKSLENNTKKVDDKIMKQSNTNPSLHQNDMPLPILCLPPGITITKVEAPVLSYNNQAENKEGPNGPTINVGKSGVIVVDTEKLIQQKPNTVISKLSKNAKKKKKKNKKLEGTSCTSPNDDKKMITLKNPIFQSYQQPQQNQCFDKNVDNCTPAAIFTNENGMVTIRSTRLHQSLSNGRSVNPTPLTSIPQFQESSVRSHVLNQSQGPADDVISAFNAQEILSGLPGIEITKVDKKSKKSEPEVSKSCETAQVSIIPASNGGDKFSLDKDDWLYESVFTPKDVLEDDMDAEELELEAFKRFCQQSVPPKRKEKVAHLNVADIVVKKKTDANFI
ncbi:putative autophagy-related protein 11 [Diorhabda sublineata]|uniref:putative autophagy-related protein 11 n=1 Tax=Diorhabda sublineata TaxID=1163346 RepID=UPI0024E0D2B0|nr:putative autophagy-related protein 11 [Diorhabda sublineata]